MPRVVFCLPNDGVNIGATINHVFAASNKSSIVASKTKPIRKHLLAERKKLAYKLIDQWAKEE